MGEKENSTPDEEFAVMMQVVYNTAKTCVGKPERKHLDWLDPSGQELHTLIGQKIHYCSIQICLEIPTMAMLAKAIAGLKDGKESGEDGIHAEVWKHEGENMFSRLHQLITNAWKVGYVPQHGRMPEL